MSPPGTIAVASSADFRTVLLISPGSGHVTRSRTPDKIVGLQVDLSTDGRKIAFAGARGIWTMSRAGFAPRLLVRVAPTAVFAPDWVVWSPSARQLAFTRKEVLYRVSVSGRRVTRIWRGRAYAPDWSPRGSSIVFVQNASLRTGSGVIQSIGVDGRHRRSIAEGGHPDVSPNGTQIAFARRDGIYVVPARGGKARRLIARGEHPEWSPDGRFIAFTREVKCADAGYEGRIFIVPVAGGEPSPVGPRIFEIGPLSWSR